MNPFQAFRGRVRTYFLQPHVPTLNCPHATGSHAGIRVPERPRAGRARAHTRDPRQPTHTDGLHPVRDRAAPAGDVHAVRVHDILRAAAAAACQPVREELTGPTSGCIHTYVLIHYTSLHEHSLDHVIIMSDSSPARLMLSNTLWISWHGALSWQVGKTWTRPPHRPTIRERL